MAQNNGSFNPVGALFGLMAAGVGGWIAYSAFGINHRAVMGPAIPAKREIFNGSSTSLLSYYVDTAAGGRPLVLFHSINAAASAYEMRPIFQHYRTLRPVYALDLPGFGFSSRDDREYTPETYIDAMIDLLERVGEPADVVTLSLGSEFAAMAALRRPDLFNTLTMISPSGFTRRGEKRASQDASDRGVSDAAYRVLSFPLWGRPFYDLLATPQSIRYFLKQSFEGPVDRGLAEYDYLTSHQPGAHYAPLYFVSGQLFTRDIRERAYARLALPVLVLYDRDNFVRFDTLPDLVAQNGNWRAVRIAPTKGLPQFEKMPAVARAMDEFWHTVG